MSVSMEKVPPTRTKSGQHFVHVRVAAKRYGYAVSVLTRWCREAPCALLGHTLRHHIHLPQGYSRGYLYILESDLEALRKATAQGGRAEDDNAGLAIAEAVKTFQLGSRHVLKTVLRHRFSSLGNRRVRTWKEPHDVEGVIRQRRLVSRRDMALALESIRTKSIRDPIPDWITAEEVYHHFKLRQGLLDRAARDGTRFLGGEKITVRKELMWVSDGRLRETRVYAPAQMRKIREGLDAETAADAPVQNELSNNEESPSALDTAKRWLMEKLGAGPQLYSQIVTEARADKIPIKTLRRARLALEIPFRQVGYQGGCYWFLRKDKDKVPPARSSKPRLEAAVSFLRPLLMTCTQAELARRARGRGISNGTFIRAMELLRTDGAVPCPAAARAGDAPVGVQPSAAHDTCGSTLKHEPLPVQPYPVTVCNPDGRPVYFTGAPAVDVGKEKSASTKKTGRPASEATEAVYKFCYEEFIVKQKKRSNVFREAGKLFGARAPKDEASVRKYACRYAERHNLPLDRPVY
jgi:hypothetical protein